MKKYIIFLNRITSRTKLDCVCLLYKNVYAIILGLGRSCSIWCAIFWNLLIASMAKNDFKHTGPFYRCQTFVCHNRTVHLMPSIYAYPLICLLNILVVTDKFLVNINVTPCHFHSIPHSQNSIFN